MSQSEKFIIDTNTLISSLLIRNSFPFKAIEKARSRGPLIFSEDTFIEFEMVLFPEKI
jgi:predicted nucleic acid-binding protein